MGAKLKEDRRFFGLTEEEVLSPEVSEMEERTFEIFRKKTVKKYDLQGVLKMMRNI